MYKTSCILSILIAISLTCGAQKAAPGIKWSKLLGGSLDDRISAPQKAALVDRDGMYLIGGYNWSDNGDVTGNHTDGYNSPTQDIWVAKLDTQRNILWSASLGGTKGDGFGSLQLAHDSGYIVAGSTLSTDGDVTGNHGGTDAWIVRLGSRGNVVWQKCLGGSQDDAGAFIAPVGDGYIFLGETSSIDGDLAAVHQAANRDIWVVKLDKNGTIIWQKCVGGSDYETASSIKQTPDGGYLITGSTYSTDLPGSHVIWDTSGKYTIPDMWVVKLDQNGTMEWQKCLGGSKEDEGYDVEISTTGSYIVAGSTFSEDGDVVGHHPTDTTYDTRDGWVVSLSPTGAIEWQKCFGTGLDDAIYDILVLPDHSIAAVGKTNYLYDDIPYFRGYPECWLLNFSNTGNLIWDKSFMVPNVGYRSQQGATLALTPAGTLMVSGYCFINGGGDIWLFEAGAVNTIAGRVFYDANSDGIQNNGELGFDKIIVRSAKNSDTTSAVPRNGYYMMDVDTGTYATKAIPYKNYYTIVPATKTSTFNNYFNSDSAHFAVQPLPGIRDVDISMIPLEPLRLGFTIQYKLLYRNVGTSTVGSGYVELIKDHRLGFVGAAPSATSINGDTIKWNYTNLAPNTEAAITLNLSAGTMPSVNLGDTLKSVAWINQDGTDVAPIDDTITLKQIAIAALDPNDKTEANAGIITPAQVTNGEYLNYTIRFQNTGTDTAYNVTVRDTLESRLDWGTLQMISASHPYQLTIEDGNKLAWQFNNVKLPYTNIDEPGSHGYLAYRIKPKPTVPAGDTIKNAAGIYFDYNLPVATNTENTIVFMVSAALPLNLLSFQAALDGSVVTVTWTTSNEENLKLFEVERSANGVDFTTIGVVQPGKTTYVFKDQQPLQGYNYYRLRSVDIDGGSKYSKTVLVNVKNDADIISSLYPNPGNGNISLKLHGIIENKISIRIIDRQGIPLFSKDFDTQRTNTLTIPLNLEMLPAGYYVLQIVTAGKKFVHKLVIR